MGGSGLATGVLVTFSLYLILLHRQSTNVEAAPSVDRLGGTVDAPHRARVHSAGSHGTPSRIATQYVRVRPAAVENGEFLIDEDDIFGDANKRQFDDYGHMRFGKREDQFDDYGHMRFGRNGGE